MGGDFNAIISDAEKEGGCRKFRVTMEEFHDVMKELSLVDIKIDKVGLCGLTIGRGITWSKRDWIDFLSQLMLLTVSLFLRLKWLENQTRITS